MLIPRYWSRAESQSTTPDGRPVRFHVWRGSRASEADAQALASEAVGRIADRIGRGAGFPERYAYGDRPLREEVIREIPGGIGDGETPDAALTRNTYGAVVLNAGRAFFIDVDLVPDPDPYGETATSASPAQNPADALWDVVDSLPLPARSSPSSAASARQPRGPRPPLPPRRRPRPIRRPPRWAGCGRGSRRTRSGGCACTARTAGCATW